MVPDVHIVIFSVIFCLHVKGQQEQRKREPQVPQGDPGCPLFFEHHGDSCYYAFDTPLLTWWDAMAFCSLYGTGLGSLAMIEDAAEQTYIENVLRSNFVTPTANNFWLGANDLAQEGTWVWIKKDKTVEYTKWGPGEPNHQGAENCLGLNNGHNYLWNDAPCEMPEAFICEVQGHVTNTVPPEYLPSINTVDNSTRVVVQIRNKVDLHFTKRVLYQSRRKLNIWDILDNIRKWTRRTPKT